MSNVIKSGRVLFNNAPRSISIENVGGVSAQQSAGDVGQMLSNNALESADASLRVAVAKAEEVENRSAIEAQLAYGNSAKGGWHKGHDDGLLKGRNDGRVSAVANVHNAAVEFTTKAFDLDMKYLQQLSGAKADCVDFAFSLAEDILGIQIDRESGEYTKLLSEFLAKRPGKATLEADGCIYKIDNFRPDGLLSAADGLQGISVSIEAPCTDEEPETKVADKAESEAEIYNKAAECEQANGHKQIDSDAQDVAEVKTAIENQNVAVEDSLKDEIETSQAEKDESLENQPESEDMGHIVDMGQMPQMQDDGYNADEINTDIENGADSVTGSEDIINSEKFVFVRPARKSVIIQTTSDSSAGHEIKYEDIARLGQDNLKVLSRKAEINDIAAALSGAGEDVSLALMNAMTRRTKEKLLDVMKYLGPVSQEDTDNARNKLAKLSTDIMKAHERDEADV